MPGFWHKMRDGRERFAFALAFALTLALGAVWFSFSLRPSVEPVQTVAEERETPGPLSRIGDTIADGLVFAALQIATLREVWSAWSFSTPIEFERSAE